jgi:hypothetical protein
MTSFYFASINTKDKEPYWDLVVGRGFVSHGGATASRACGRPAATGNARGCARGQRGRAGRGESGPRSHVHILRKKLDRYFYFSCKCRDTWTVDEGSQVTLWLAAATLLNLCPGVRSHIGILLRFLLRTAYCKIQKKNFLPHSSCGSCQEPSVSRAQTWTQTRDMHMHSTSQDKQTGQLQRHNDGRSRIKITVSDETIVCPTVGISS